MNTDRLPHNTDSDDYIRKWAVDRCEHMQAVTYVSLLSTCRDAPNMASINWLLPGEPITRYNDTTRRMI